MSPRVRRSAAVATGGLALVAALHAAWMVTSWPLESDAEFAEVVVGSTEGQAPPAAASAAMALLLGIAAWLIWRRARAPLEAQPWYVRIGAWVVATVLLIRGALGLLVSGLDVTTSPPRYDLWDVRIYSPVCLVLGALSLLVAVAGERFADRRTAQSVWAGRMIVFIALAHIVGWTDFARDQLSGWLEGSSRTTDLPVDEALSQADAYFWAFPGSAAPVGLLLGMLVIRLGRAGTVIPAFVGWSLGSWAVVVTFIMPTPIILLTIPAGLIVLAARERQHPTAEVADQGLAASYASRTERGTAPRAGSL